MVSLFELPAGALDSSTLEQPIRDGKTIVAMGPSGGYDGRTLAQQDAYVASLQAAAQGRAPVILGVLEAATDRAIERIRSHQRHGEAAYLVPIHHHFGVSNPSEITAHYRAILKATGVPIYALDWPARTRRAMSEDEVRSVLAISGVLGVFRYELALVEVIL